MTKNTRGMLALALLALGIGLKVYYQQAGGGTATTEMISNLALGAGTSLGLTYLV